MNIIKIPENRLVRSKYVEGWNMSIFGNPKLTIQCGQCSGIFKTREYYPHRRFDNRLTACCQYCGFWNLTPFYG